MPGRDPALDLAKDIIGRLPFEDQEELHAFLARLVTPAMAEGSARTGPPRRRKAPRGTHLATLRTRERTETTRSEYVRCGKPTCRCAKGKLHGPYAYKYWRDEKGRLRKAYVGKARSSAAGAASASPAAPAQPARRAGDGSPRA